ncbi:helix-turn-helix domain-containing protein [Streptomyces johnsoniae]|uniref:Helix-turn-helix transcriptional regulator n=1 Tax=Streptomyces johnsoniae TaxID=3075532 RepID=A0ABU2S4F0_9ACTN|nr:helix-turn-helix transcriptional regulator [Streptomyces sp. DSM 41886]MDT0443859.1 helix-turn-helix transcriptional regulator [Streptomyces sp. DSM 41886]
MAAVTGSTVPRRQLGRHLRELRMRARFTLKAAAHELEWSEAKMWRIESGQTSVRSHDVRTMCEIYGAPPDLAEALLGLAKETKARGWWHSYGDVIPEQFDVFIGLEEAASEIDWYESDLVPGLFQTADYARTVMHEYDPKLSPEEVGRRVALRLARQALLTRPTNAALLRVVLSESVVRRPVGGHKAMAQQIRRMIELSALPVVSLRVVPFSVGFHQGVLTSQFGILRFPTNGNGAPTEPPTVYADGYTGDLYLDKEKEVNLYDEAFANIWSVALSEEATTDLLTDLVGRYEQVQD